MSTSTLDRDRKWFLDTFAKASQLESRLIPDILGAKEGSVVKAVFPVSIDLPDDVLRTAFGLTLSVWSADTKACFSTAWGEAPESPVFVEWTPETPLKELTDAVRKQLEGALKHGAYSYDEAAKDLELDRSVHFGGPAAPKEVQLPEGTDVAFYLEKKQMTVFYRSDRYSEGILRQFADSFSVCAGSMEKAGTAGELEFATKAQVDEVDGFNPAPVAFDPDVTPLELFRKNAAKLSGHPAVVYKGTLLTYAQLDKLTDNLAAHIAGIVKPGGVVSIILNRNEYAVVAPLAVLKAGW